MLYIEPRLDSSISRDRKLTHLWPQPDIVDVIGGKVRLVNNSSDPQVLCKNEHFCQVRPVMGTLLTPESDIQPVGITRPITSSSHSELHSQSVQVDPDGLISPDMRAKFRELLLEYDDVFDPSTVGYTELLVLYRQ